MSKRFNRGRANARAGGGSATWRQKSRPWRIVPLALFAVAATTAAMGAAAHVARQASHHQYADDILRHDLKQVHVKRLLS